MGDAGKKAQNPNGMGRKMFVFVIAGGHLHVTKQYVSLTASVYHPVLRKLVSLATMECSGENTSTISLFWWLCF